MAIIRRGKAYWLDIRVKGKRLRRSLHTSNIEEAKEEAKYITRQLVAEYRDGEVRFADLCDKYLSWAWSSKPASTKREQQRLSKIKEFFNNIGIIYLSDITPYHIDQLKAHLKNEAEGRGEDKGLSKATVNRYLQILRGMFYKAIDWSLFEGPNPLKRIKFYRENTKIRTLSDFQVKKLLQEALSISKNPGSPLQARIHDLITVAINTGMRKSEILNLEWKDVYPKTDAVEIQGKGDKIRTIPLNFRAKAVIIRQPKKNEYVFDIPNRHQQDLLRRTINQLRKRTGFQFSFHDFRHYFATKLVERGVDFVTVSEILGHSKIMVSLRYSHTDEARKRDAVNSLEK